MNELIRQMLEQHRIAITRMSEITNKALWDRMVALSKPDKSDFQTMSERAKAMSQDRYNMGCELKQSERLDNRIN